MLSGPGQTLAHADTPDPDAACSTGAAPYLCVTFPTPGQDGKVVLIGRDELYDAAGDCASASCDVSAKNGDYRIRSDGSSDGHDAFTGLSLANLTSYASQGATTAADVTFVQINRTVHTSTYVSVIDNGAGYGQLATSPAPFQGGFPPAVYFTNNPRSYNVGYARPLRNDDDDNAADNFEVGNGNYEQQNFLHVTVHTSGKVLHPTVSAASGPEKDGKKTVTLTAGVPDGNGTALTYAWNCDGGTPPDGGATGASIACTYTSAVGAAYPSVVVTGADTSYGYARLKDAITVDPATGGDGGDGGGGNGGKTDPSGGAKTGSGTKSGGVPTGAAGSGDRPGNGAGTTAPVGAGGNGTGATGATGTDVPRSAGPGAPSRGPTDPPRAAGELVNGQLLVAPQGAVQAAGPSDSPGQARAPVARRRSSPDLDLRQLWWLVPIGLVGLGVFAERRRPRRQGSRV